MDDSDANIATSKSSRQLQSLLALRKQRQIKVEKRLREEKERLQDHKERLVALSENIAENLTLCQEIKDNFVVKCQGEHLSMLKLELIRSEERRALNVRECLNNHREILCKQYHELEGEIENLKKEYLLKMRKVLKLEFITNKEN